MSNFPFSFNKHVVRRKKLCICSLNMPLEALFVASFCGNSSKGNMWINITVKALCDGCQTGFLYTLQQKIKK